MKSNEDAVRSEIQEANNDMLGLLVKKHIVGNRLPGDKTAKEFSEETHIDQSHAYDILNAEVAKGTLVKVKVNDNGKRIQIYRNAAG